MFRPPVVLLAFANDRVADARYLRNLPAERRGIRKALQPLEDRRAARVYEVPNATAADIVAAFLVPDHVEQVAIFHFGGHANDTTLMLEDDVGRPAAVPADGVAEYLARQKRLVLVFLNGCATRAQVARLRGLGVKAVIATSRAIRDDVAAKFADLFYQHLRAHPLKEAYDLATVAVKMDPHAAVHSARHAYFDLGPEAPGEPLEWPWQLDCDKDVEGWRLVPRRDVPLPGTQVEGGKVLVRGSRSGPWSVIGGCALLACLVVVRSIVDCLSASADVTVKLLAALSAGLLGGGIVRAIKGARHDAGTPSRRAGAAWILALTSAAGFSAAAAAALFLAAPPVASRCGVSVAELPPTPPRGMVYVPGGSFHRGTTRIEEPFAGCRDVFGDECAWRTFERERHHAGRVDVPAFFIDEHEVTNARLAAFMVQLHAAGEARVEPEIALLTVGPSPPRVLVRFAAATDDLSASPAYRAYAGDGTSIAPVAGMADRPAVLVTWDLAARYCRAQGKRLPTETEWEYAARGPEGREYVWGDRVIRCGDAAYGRHVVASDHAYVECGNEEQRPNPVGTSALDRAWCGAADLGVNVSEWVADAFVDPDHGCPAAAEPSDPAEATLCHVYKGGNWVDAGQFARPAYRPVAAPSSRFASIGFRCAASLKEAP